MNERLISQYILNKLEVFLRSTGRNSDKWQSLRSAHSKNLPIILSVVFMHRCQALVPSQWNTHLKCACGVHIGTDQRSTAPLFTWVQKSKITIKIYFASRFQVRLLWLEQDIVEIKFNLFINYRFLNGFNLSVVLGKRYGADLDENSRSRRQYWPIVCFGKHYLLLKFKNSI
jgi:hypothetical protein